MSAELTIQVISDRTGELQETFKQTAIALLQEAGGELAAHAAAHSRRDTGAFAGAWTHKVDAGALECQVGNPQQLAIWHEFGTGVFAVRGGRKTPWVYKSERTGRFHRTQGQRPNPVLKNAFKALNGKIQAQAKARFSSLGR